MFCTYKNFAHQDLVSYSFSPLFQPLLVYVFVHPYFLPRVFLFCLSISLSHPSGPLFVERYMRQRPRQRCWRARHRERYFGGKPSRFRFILCIDIDNTQMTYTTDMQQRTVHLITRRQVTQTLRRDGFVPWYINGDGQGPLWNAVDSK